MATEKRGASEPEKRGSEKKKREEKKKKTLGSVNDFRFETDSMGEIKVPAVAYWGAQTQRAVENFSISPLRAHPQFISALVTIKKVAALVNKSKKVLDTRRMNAIVQAVDEIVKAIHQASRGKKAGWDVRDGGLECQFPVDVFQTGSGTSWNMNVNEVIANRANEILGAPRGVKQPIHPNDHVNKGQSSNDCIPTALYVSCRIMMPRLISRVTALRNAFRAKAQEFQKVIKLGRTHLQDAVPMTFGQEFGAFAEQIEFAREQLQRIITDFEIIPQGGTAVGTGLNAEKGFASSFARKLSEQTKLPFKAAKSPFTRMAAAEPFVALAGAINVLSVALAKIAQDLRILSSGPRAALGEVVLPSLQPGSSIMPGKVNPVIPEMVMQAAAHLMGKAESIKISCQNAPLQLNMMFPLLSHECLTAIELATHSCAVFVDRCVGGITVDEERARYWIEHSLALVTPLAKRIGYDKAAAVAHEAYRRKVSVRTVIAESKELQFSAAEIDALLDPSAMI